MDDDIHQVLLIEPDAASQQEMTGILEPEFVVLGASSVPSGLEVASRRDPAVAVIADSALAGSAERTLAALRAASPGLRAVFLTESHDPEVTRLLAGLGPVLLRPVAEERLLQAIRNALRFQGMSAGVARLRASTGSFTVPPEIRALALEKPTEEG